MKRDGVIFTTCYEKSALILTEGAVGTRITHQFELMPDNDIRFAGLIYDTAGRRVLETIYRQYLQIAEDYMLPILLTTNTRSANQERVSRSQFRDENVITDYAGFLRTLTGQYKTDSYIGGIIGCKGDAYSGDGSLNIEESECFHEWQVNEFERAKVDFIYEAIMPSVDEIIGISRLIERKQIPYIVSFTIRKNGRIIDGHTIHDAITVIDGSLKQKPVCYMTNCVHPDILRSALSVTFNRTETVRNRFKGIQANAACDDPEALDGLSELKSSTADELAESFIRLNEVQQMKICGGCCGTNDNHIRKIAAVLSTMV